MLLSDGGGCFLGLTPDGAQPGRDLLARLSLWQDETELSYAIEQADGVLCLRAECGYVNLTLGFPERLMIEGEGVSLLIGKGRAVGMFMSGGSAVDDPLPGALYVNAGARMRIVPKTGSAEVRSAWNLNALSDPDPRIFLHPAVDGSLRAAVYVTDFDETPAEADAPEAAADFERFLSGLIAAPRSDDAVHAAYVVWSCLQPARRLAEARIDAPVYVSNRRTLGSACLSDNVLLAALLADPAESARQMSAFLPLAGRNGVLPRLADNRSRLYEAETPYFGLVLHVRPDVAEALDEAEFEGLADALSWWLCSRWDPERKQFYYLHRYESGFGPKAPFPEDAPLYSPWLNACMRLWLDAMAALAKKFGRGAMAADYEDAARALNGTLPEEKATEAQVLPLLLAGNEKLAEQIRQTPPEVISLRRALTVLAADLAERGLRHAD